MTIADELRPRLLERFIRYVRIHTQSDPKSSTYPSTACQLDLLRLLRGELVELGVPEVRLEERG